MWFRKKEVVEYSEDDLKKLEDYIYNALCGGFNDDDIRKKLISSGWTKKAIEDKLSKCKIRMLNPDASLDKKAPEEEVHELPLYKGRSENSKLNEKSKDNVIKRVETPKVELIGYEEEKIKEKKIGENMPKKILSKLIKREEIKPEEAKQYLADVAEDRRFWVNNGPVIKNMEELAGCLKEMSDETFGYHVNSEKNDFANWINDVVGDKKLAKGIAKAKDKNSFLGKVENRLNELKGAA